MSFSKIIDDLISHFICQEKKSEALRNLVLNGKISQETFNSVEKKMNHVLHIALDLKNALEDEESYWRTSCLEQQRILETFLIELEHRRLLGEIGEEEWSDKNRIINWGLDSLRYDKCLARRDRLAPALPIQKTLEEHTTEFLVERPKDKEAPAKEIDRSIDRSAENGKTVSTSPKQKEETQLNSRKKLLKEPSDLTPHCMNPWKSECRNTDINLSIYYDGRMVAICRKCWEDISEKNLEWSSL